MQRERVFTVYGQLQALFEVRKIHWKAWLLATPWWLAVPMVLAVLATDAKIAVVDASLHRVGQDVLIFVVALPLGIWTAYKVRVQHSIVEFHRVHEPHGIQRRLAEWKPYIIAAIAAIIGAFSKELFELIAHALKK
jgi:hypothetical protein